MPEKFTPELGRALLGIIASRPNLRNAARVCGIAEASLHSYIRRSKAGDPLFICDWPQGSEPRQFCENLILARRANLLQYESAIRDEVNHGLPRVLRHASTGDVIYEKNPKFIGVPDEDMVLLGYDKPSVEWWRILRDDAGLPVPVVVRDPAPAHLKIAVLRTIPGYGEHKTVDMTVKSSSVLVVGAPKPYEPPPPPQMHAPLEPERQIAMEQDLDADLPEGGNEIAPTLAEMAGVTPPVTPPAPSIPVNSPALDALGDNALVRDLKNRLAAKQAGVTLAPPPRSKFQSDDDLRENIGEAKILPGGVKVR